MPHSINYTKHQQKQSKNTGAVALHRKQYTLALRVVLHKTIDLLGASVIFKFPVH